MKAIKLRRIYPTVVPVNLAKRSGKQLLVDLIPLGSIFTELLAEVSLQASSVWGKRLLRKPPDHDWIVFQAGEIRVNGKEGSSTFRISEISNLKICYHRNLIVEREEDVDETQFKNQISRVTFQTGDEQHEYFYENKKREVIKLCKALYEQGVLFKEYSHGRRVFLGRQPKYSEVQTLKEKYRIEW